MQISRQDKGRGWLLFKILPAIILLISCKSENITKEPDPEEVPVDTTDTAIIVVDVQSRIAWDLQSLTRVSSGGYARIKELKSGVWIAVYSRSANVYMIISEDKGATWVGEQLIFEGTSEYIFTNAEAIELENEGIIVGANRRIREDYFNQSFRYAIAVRRTMDRGVSWSDPQVIYEAGTNSATACWEPSFLQMPDGQVHCYFANENPYPNSNEQQISLLRSLDNGQSWSATPDNIAFASGARDGMPNAILLEDQDELLLSIEDNHSDHVLQPVVIREFAEDNWASTVNADDQRRIHAIRDYPKEHYSGAPYIGQLHTGEIILSYQDRELPPRPDKNDIMRVRIANEEDLSFDRMTTPFDISDQQQTLWNSLTVLSSGDVLAVTGTDAYSPGGVYFMKGKVLSPFTISESSTSGAGFNDELTQMFVGHSGRVSVSSYMAQPSSDSLVLRARIHHSDGRPQNYGMNVYLDTRETPLVTIDQGVYKVEYTGSAGVKVYSGDNRSWVFAGGLDDMQVSTQLSDQYMDLEITLPWSYIGGSLNHQKMRVSLGLLNDNGTLIETLVHSAESDPTTWMEATIK